MKSGDIRALVTGGAGGIGGAIAAELLARGAAVLAVGRDEAALGRAALRHSAHGERIGTTAADLTIPADRRRVSEMAAGWRGGVNVLVNNAGVNHFSMFEDLAASQIDAALAVNVAAPLHLCRELLPHLARQSEARILNIGSVFGAIGYPGNAVYSASKFALRGFSEALRRELAGSSIREPVPRSAGDSDEIQHGCCRAHERRARRRDGSARIRGAGSLGVDRLGPSGGCRWLAGETIREGEYAAPPRLVDLALRKQLPTICRHATDAISTPRLQSLASRPLTGS